MSNYSNALAFFIENGIYLNEGLLSKLKKKFNKKNENNRQSQSSKSFLEPVKKNDSDNYIKACKSINKAVIESLNKLNRTKELAQAFYKANNDYKRAVGENLDEFEDKPPYYGCPQIVVDSDYDKDYDSFSYYIEDLSQDTNIQFVTDICPLLYDKLKQNPATRRYCSLGIISGVSVIGDGDEGEISLNVDRDKLRELVK